MRAAKLPGRSLQPVRVKINRGRFGIFVTISDRGGGIEKPDRVWRWGTDIDETKKVYWNYHLSTDDAELEWSTSVNDSKYGNGQKRPIPLGFGLPLARLTARYFGGDLKLQTLLGSGTSAYLHIPELQPQSGSVGS